MMAKTISKLILILVLVPAAFAASFIDDFNRVESYPSITNWDSTNDTYLDGSFMYGILFNELSNILPSYNTDNISVSTQIYGYTGYNPTIPIALTQFITLSDETNYISASVYSNPSSLTLTLLLDSSCDYFNYYVEVMPPTYPFSYNGTLGFSKQGNLSTATWGAFNVSHEFNCSIATANISIGTASNYVGAGGYTNNLTIFTGGVPNITCSILNGCILYETYAYSDSIYNNGWDDLTGNPLPELNLTPYGNSLWFNNYDGMLNNIHLYKNFTNPAINYDIIEFDGLFGFSDNSSYPTSHNMTFALTDGVNAAIWLELLYHDGNDTLDVYYHFGSSSAKIDSVNISTDPNHFYDLNFEMNFATHIIEIYGYNLLFNEYIVPDRIVFFSGDMDSSVASIYNHNIDITGRNQSPQCNDGIDNDGDNLTDYPIDPECSSISEDNEYPQNFHQCNDGVDNDGDGIIDYPNEINCISPTNGTELPKQSSNQPQDECPVASFCLFKDTFIYNDDLIFHNWTYDRVYEIIGVPTAFNCTSYNTTNCGYNPTFSGIGQDYSLNLAKSYENYSAYHADFVNPNTYSDNIAELRFLIEGQGLHPESVNVTLSQGAQTAIRLNLNIDRENTYNIGGSTYQHRVAVYASSAQVYYFAGYAYIKDGEELALQLVLNNDARTFTIKYDDSTRTSFADFNTTFIYDNPVIPNNLDIYANTQKNYIFLNSIHIFGAFIQSTTTCNTFTKPRYLYETFDYGLISDCGWVTNKDINVLGEFSIKNDDGEISAYKQLQYNGQPTAITAEKSRYVTIQFDEYIDSQSIDTAYTNIVAVQDTQNNILAVLSFDKGMGTGRMFSSDGGLPEIVTSAFGLDAYHTIKLIIDLVDDTQTILIDGVTYWQNGDLNLAAYDYDNVATFTIASYGSQYKIDNVIIYTSDQSGNQVVVVPSPQNQGANGTYWRGLFFNTAPSCLVDADCLSGKCMSYGSCSTFNWLVCDEAGKERDNYCILSEMTLAAFGWIGDVIMDNFLYFVLFLILLMIMVYMAIMFRNKR